MNRPPYRRSDEIAAYTYQADIYCPACLIETMIADGIAAPAARDMLTDDVLEQCAGALAEVLPLRCDDLTGHLFSASAAA